LGRRLVIHRPRVRPVRPRNCFWPLVAWAARPCPSDNQEELPDGDQARDASTRSEAAQEHTAKGHR
jgi:hypothetical protein